MGCARLQAARLQHATRSPAPTLCASYSHSSLKVTAAVLTVRLPRAVDTRLLPPSPAHRLPPPASALPATAPGSRDLSHPRPALAGVAPISAGRERGWVRPANDGWPPTAAPAAAGDGTSPLRRPVPLACSFAARVGRATPADAGSGLSRCDPQLRPRRLPPHVYLRQLHHRSQTLIPTPHPHTTACSPDHSRPPASPPLPLS